MIRSVRSAMPRMLAALAVVTVLSSSAAWPPAGAATKVDVAPQSALARTPYADGRILVRFRGGVSGTASANKAHGRIGARTGRRFSIVDGLELAELPAGVTVEEAVAAYNAMPEVLYAEPDYVVSIDAVPSDAQFSNEWGLHNIGQTVNAASGTPDADIDAPEAWNVTTGSSSVVVAVIDTGVDYTHSDLATNMWVNPGETAGNGLDDDHNGFVDDVHGADTMNRDGDPMDDHGHGTHVAGTIGAQGNNGIGVTGVNWDVSIMALKAFNASGASTTSTTLEAMQYAHDKGADVINCSWGGWYPLATGVGSEYEGIAAMSDTLFVFAAGNEGKDITSSWPGGKIGTTDYGPNPDWFYFPAGYDLPNIIAVGASDHNDASASFSNFSATRVDLFAPGYYVLSTRIGNQYGSMSGTSMATPHVAGAAALVLSTQPSLTAPDLKSAILNSVDVKAGLGGRCVTGGRLNVARALGLPGNNPPVAQPDAYSVAEGAPAVLAVTANDSDPDADPLAPLVDVVPAHGTVTSNQDGTLTYRSDWNWSGTDSFTYMVTDGMRVSAPASVTLSVSDVAPVVSIAGVANGQTSVGAVKPVFSADHGTVTATLNDQPFASDTVLAAPGSYRLVVTAVDFVGHSVTREVAFGISAPVVLEPVYRFFNPGNGTHFFTNSADEMNRTIHLYSAVFAYEGVAYYTNPANNTQPLYRFYNVRSGSHFYTASRDEANYVIATYPSIFTFEGETYRVSTGETPGSIAVYRFYNLRNGSHFFTASLAEANSVIANYSSTYRFEGPAFWLGQ